ncbi:MAG: peptide chain release factor N(5)-glutamine methyltransferase [Flavobacteriales bacterium]|nr:peptide chain release factor N(5)-glutamine methyltransferase [Flavobacteriales bacterium]
MRLQSNTLSAMRARYVADLSGRYTSGEARALFREVARERLGWDDARLLLDDQVRLSESELLALWRPLKALHTGMPLQYVLGSTLFHGLRIQVDPRVLIPRPETEELVERILNARCAYPRIVDVCTGSGCIALALKAALPGSEVMGTDVSADALELARANASQLGLEVTFRQHDALCDPLPAADLIVSNPPYVPRAEADSLEPHVRAHEPHLALFVDDGDPLLFYRQIGKAARQVLRPGGELWFETHRDHAVAVADLMRALGFAQASWHADLSGQPRFVHAQ